MQKQKEPVWLKIIRILLGCLFIFSGLMKAVDPIASAIKIDEYFISFGMDFMHPFSMFFGVCLSTAEFALGFMLLHRIYVRFTADLYLLFMGFFLLLTAWLAVAEHLEIHYGYDFGVVKDCGCFGQAVAMSNLQTFLKNVVVIIPTIIIFAKRKSIPDIRLNFWGQFCYMWLGAIIAFAIQFYCYRHLPFIDFSDWKKGDNVADAFVDQPAEKSILYLYQKTEDSSLVYLSEDEMMAMYDEVADFDQQYTYVDRKDSIIRDLVRAKIPGFTMTDAAGGEHSFELINVNNNVPLYLLFMHNLSETDLDGLQSENLKSLIAYCEKNHYNFVGITNSSDEEIAEFCKTNDITFPIFHNAIDLVKGPFMARDAVRSNPGLIKIQNGIVQDKWAWRDFPSGE